MKEKKTGYKHQKDNCANSDVEVSPTPIIGFGAARRSGDVTGLERRFTGIFVVSEESPGNYLYHD